MANRNRQPARLPWRILVLLCVTIAWLLSFGVAAADGDVQKILAFEILLPEAKINRGADYSVLRPSGSTWADPEPFGDAQEIEFWYPYAQTPEVREFTATNLSDRATGGEMFAWQQGKWVHVTGLAGSLHPVNNLRQEIVLRFASPVSARGFKLRLTGTEDRDYDVLKLADARFRGTGAGVTRLFPAEALSLRVPAQYNVFDLPQPARIVAALGVSGGGKFRLEVQVRPVNYGRTAMRTETVDAELTTGQEWSRAFSFPGLAQGPYFATALVRDADTGVVLAARRILFGMRDPELARTGQAQPFDAPGATIPLAREIIKNEGCLWGFDATQGMAGLSQSPQAGMFARMKRAGGREAFSVLAYHEFEPLPGVYNFSYFDHVVNNARQTGMLLTLGIWWWDFSQTEQWWLEDGLVRGADGKVDRSWGAHLSPFSRHAQDAAGRATTALAQRYVHSPEVVLWHPHAYGIVDHDGHGIFDYHPDALAQWSEYLQAKYHDIAALNRAYATAYSGWAAVPVPRPLWDELLRGGQWEEGARLLDLRPAWRDWLDFYHGGVLHRRIDMMQRVRAVDTHRTFAGMNASGGVGKAEEVYAALAQQGAFYGDQGINGVEFFRRAVAQRRYGLPLRLEDIAALVPGKNGVSDPAQIIDRSHWDTFQLGAIAPEHFNYVFPATGSETAESQNYFFREVYSSDAVRAMLAEAVRTPLRTQPVALLHSFLTDIYEGKYHYEGISLQRWWRMEGWSAANYAPGMMCDFYSDDCPRPELTKSRLIIDDGSRVMPKALAQELAQYVAEGGKLSLAGGPAAEASLPQDGAYPLLRALGYPVGPELTRRRIEPGQLVMQKDNPVCRRVVSLPLQFWSALRVPDGGKVVGRVGKEIAAVWWRHGKGEVVLLGGIPAAITEGEVLKMMSNRDPKRGAEAEKLLWDSWANAERDCAATAAALLPDFLDWAGLQPLYTVSGEMQSVLRAVEEKTVVYLYNKGPAHTPVLRIPGLRAGRFRISTFTLEQKQPIERNRLEAEEISSPGIALPQLGHHRFMMVRVERTGE